MISYNRRLVRLLCDVQVLWIPPFVSALLTDQTELVAQISTVFEVLWQEDPDQNDYSKYQSNTEPVLDYSKKNLPHLILAIY